MAPSKSMSWKNTLHEVIFEADTRAGKLFDIVLLILILGSVATVMLESVNSIANRTRTDFKYNRMGIDDPFLN